MGSINPPDPKPGLPVDNPCLSFWQQTTRSFPYLNANKDIPVPSSTRYVVIGSGISGALAVFELIEAGIPGRDIVVLEAREAASGASSRNAGHVRPGLFIRAENTWARAINQADFTQMLSEASRSTSDFTAPSKL